MKLRLSGKGELVDKFNRLHVYSDTSSMEKLKRIVKDKFNTGEFIAPIQKNTFVVNCKKAKIFAPTLTKDLSKVISYNVSLLCEVKKYTMISQAKHNKGQEIHGWTLMCEEVHIVDV